MKKLNDYTLSIGTSKYKPVVIGAMGVDISTKELALIAAEMGGIGHISDAMITVVTDRHLGTNFVSDKLTQNRHHKENWDKSEVCFDLNQVREATRIYAEDVMKAKKGPGAVFANCMEKLTMNEDKPTLTARLNGLLDGGIDGITLAAGLHMGSFAMIEKHPRFREAKLGIIVSSARALRIFLLKSKKTKRRPDYVIVEGPLAGGHLGFAAEDLKKHTLASLVVEVRNFMQEEGLDIPIIAAGGIFTGKDAVEMLEIGADAVQVATRFTITKECGLPYNAKQAYIKARKEDIVVRGISPTGYPMRLLRQSPTLGKGGRPNCEAFGYLLTNSGTCAYIDAYLREKAKGGTTIAVHDKICMCTAMRNYQCWTCGATTYRLKDTVKQLPNGEYALPSAKTVLEDYLYNTETGHAPLPLVNEVQAQHV
jgi:NAD(P)H-dependent flavin oxidoreductase YrpB (nitropropane dioxygenase family)